MNSINIARLRLKTVYLVCFFPLLIWPSIIWGQGEFGYLNHYQLASHGAPQPWENHSPAGHSYFDDSAHSGHETDACCASGQEEGCYNLRVFGGWNFLGGDRDFNRGWALGGAVGRSISNHGRVELEFTYRHNAGDQTAGVVGNLNSYSLLSNYIHEMKQLQLAGFTPYIGGGVGVSLINGSFQDNMLPLSVDDPAFAYQGIAGVAKKISRRAEIFGEYRYFGTTRVDFSGPFSSERAAYSAENVLIGLQLRY